MSTLEQHSSITEDTIGFKSDIEPIWLLGLDPEEEALVQATGLSQEQIELIEEKTERAKLFIDAEESLAAALLAHEDDAAKNPVDTLADIVPAVDNLIDSIINLDAETAEVDFQVSPDFASVVLIAEGYAAEDQAIDSLPADEGAKFATSKGHHLAALNYIVNQTERPLDEDVKWPLQAAIETHKINPSDTNLMDLYHDYLEIHGSTIREE